MRTGYETPIIQNQLEKEADMVKGCRVGDNSARKQLYTLYSERLLAVCYRYTGDLDAAHDVLHDGFVKVFSNFSYRGESSLLTWLTRIMVNTALDYLRRQQRRQTWVADDEALLEVADELTEEEYESNISEAELLQLVAELPEGCRMVFNLYVFEQKSHKEIAAILGIKEHSSTSQLHRAKSMLVKRIKDYIAHEERR